MKVWLDMEPDDLVLGVRATKWLLSNPQHKDAVIAYENGIDIYVKRTKSGISARAVTRNVRKK